MIIERYISLKILLLLCINLVNAMGMINDDEQEVLLTTQSHHALELMRNIDQEMLDLAQSKDIYRNVLLLETTIPLCGNHKITIFSGSCTYLGDGIALTNAHCVYPWTWQGQVRLPMRVRVQEASNTQPTRVYAVEEIIIHPEWLKTKQRPFDLALVRLKQPIGECNGFKIRYDLPVAQPVLFTETYNIERAAMDSFHNKPIVSVGYGTSGDVGGYGRNDGQLRASALMINNLASFGKNSQTLSLIDIFFGVEFSAQKWVSRPLMIAEGGFRKGMSGGAILLDNELVALNASSHHNSKKLLTKIKYRLLNKFKYVTALGIPMPFINPEIGYVFLGINLAVHQKWIEDYRKKIQ